MGVINKEENIKLNAYKFVRTNDSLVYFNHISDEEIDGSIIEFTTSKFCGLVEKSLWENIKIFQNLNVSDEVIPKALGVKGQELDKNDYLNNPDLYKWYELAKGKFGKYFCSAMNEFPLLSHIDNKKVGYFANGLIMIGKEKWYEF